MKRTFDNAAGVTLVELIVVISVLGILAGLLFGPFNTLYNSNVDGLRSVVQTADTRGALRVMEQDLTFTSKFLPENTINDYVGNIPGQSTVKWKWTGNPSANTDLRVLIIEGYGIRAGTGGGSRDIILNTSNCDQSIPITINNVFFVENGTLYKRTLKQSGTSANTGCFGYTVGQKRTCQGSYNNPGICEARDAVILKNVTKFDVRYFLEDQTEITTAYSGTGGALVNAKTITISITTSVGNAADKEVTSSMRITRLN